MPSQTISVPSIPSYLKRLNRFSGVTTVYPWTGYRTIYRQWQGGRVKPSGRWLSPSDASFETTYQEMNAFYVWDDNYSRRDEWSGVLDTSVHPMFAIWYLPIFHANLKMRGELDLRKQAEVDCLNRIQSGKVNLAQAFAERRQTANLLAGTARRLAASVTNLKRGNVAGALRALGSPSNRTKLSSRDIADQWLEIQYGWKPLLSDVYASVDKLRKRDEDLNRYMLTAKRRVQSNASYTDTFTSTDVTRVSVAEYEASLYVRLDYRVKHQVVASMSSMGVLDPLTLAWELLPWSFVVDWFLPIGSYLSACSATQGLEFKGGSRSLRMTTRANSTWKASNPSGPHKIAKGLGTYSQKRVVRTAYPSSPTPKFPSMKDPLSLAHMENALALLRGAFRR